jgi:RNA polymerase sigma-70 factor (ECF subfamily)
MAKEKSIFSLKINSEATFKKLFDEYYASLYFFAKNMLKDEFVADDIIQEVFYELWEKRKTIEIKSISGFLYTDARHRCLNYLKHEKVREKHILYEKYNQDSSINSMLHLYEEELMREIKKLINTMPVQQQEVFKHLLNNESLSEIAEIMSISKNTVKTHLLRARKFLREKLKNSLYLLFLIKYSDFL